MTLTFKTPLGFILSVGALSIAAAPVTTVEEKAPLPEYCTLGSVIGAQVSMLPGAQAAGEAKKDQEVAARPIGKVTDLLIDSGSGESRWSVVSFDTTLGFGGKSVAIPCDQLRWNKIENRFDIEQTEDHLKKLPTFDCADAKKRGFELSVASLVEHWPNSAVGAKEDFAAQQRPSITIDGKRFDCAKPQLMLATDIVGNAVYANSEKFGTVSGGLIDHATHAIGYFMVSRGGTLGVGGAEYIIPFYAMCTHGGNDGTDMVYSCLHSVKDLEAGVRYVKPADGAVDVEALRRANEVFAADAPKTRTASN
jgi:PRC-barrel domain